MDTYKLFFGISEKKKRCSKCREGKSYKEFSKDKSKKDGCVPRCKECVKQYHKQGYEENKEHIKQQHKQWRKENKEHIKQQNKQGYEENKEYRKQGNKQGYEENKEHIKQYHKQGYEENKEHIKQQHKQGYEENKEHRKKYKKKYYEKKKEYLDQYRKKHENSPVKYKSQSKIRKEIELYEEIKESNNGNLMCKCAYCGEGFGPNYKQIKNRIQAINGKYSDGAEHRLYCSNKCKRNCPIYRQTGYSKDQKTATSREVQPELRQMVFDRDNYTCQKCNAHRDNLEVGIHCHHKEGILGEPLQSADIDMCITLCEDCHKEVHDIDGCGYNEMKCTG